MKKVHLIFIILSSAIAIGLIIWQVKHLQVSQNLKSKIDAQELQSILKTSAIQFREIEVRDTSFIKNSLKQREVINEIIKRNFNEIDDTIIWGVYDGNGDPKMGYEDVMNLKELIVTPNKVCLSCLVMIDMLDQGNSDSKNKSFILDHTPAQISKMRGFDNRDLEYLHVFIKPFNQNFQPYILPSIFLLSLISILFYLFYLNASQRRLIRQKNEFVNHLSHEFQTPLSSIKLSSNLLSKDHTENRKELIQIIQTESKRLENHIKTVLHWVKSDANRVQINKKTINVNEIIQYSINQMKPIFLSSDTRIHFKPIDDEIVINADTNHLQLMLFNIWENAIKHNENSIEIFVNCMKVGNMIQISTKDNGKGLEQPESDIKFKGLGLMYIENMMTDHNGNTEILSVINDGVTINLNFPYNG